MFDRKRISANSNPNVNPKTFSGKQNDIIFWASIQKLLALLFPLQPKTVQKLENYEDFGQNMCSTDMKGNFKRDKTS